MWRKRYEKHLYQPTVLTINFIFNGAKERPKLSSWMEEKLLFLMKHIFRPKRPFLTGQKKEIPKIVPLFSLETMEETKKDKCLQKTVQIGLLVTSGRTTVTSIIFWRVQKMDANVGEIDVKANVSELDLLIEFKDDNFLCGYFSSCKFLKCGHSASRGWICKRVHLVRYPYKHISCETWYQLT